MTGVINKRCPKCNLVDLTDFSKCKGCGAKYEKYVDKSVEPGAPPMFMWLLLGGVIFSLFAFQGQIMSAMEKLSSVTLAGGETK